MPDSVEIDEDGLYECLSNERRRAVIHVLASLRPPVTKSELADRVTLFIHGPQYSSQDRKRVLIGLHQAHLDTLENHGVIEEIAGRKQAFEPTPLAFALDELRAAIEDVVVVDAGHTSLRERLAATGGGADV